MCPQYFLVPPHYRHCFGQHTLEAMQKLRPIQIQQITASTSSNQFLEPIPSAQISSYHESSPEDKWPDASNRWTSTCSILDRMQVLLLPTNSPELLASELNSMCRPFEEAEVRVGQQNYKISTATVNISHQCLTSVFKITPKHFFF